MNKNNNCILSDYQTLKGCNGRYLTFNTDDTITCTAEDMIDSTHLQIRTRGNKVFVKLY